MGEGGGGAATEKEEGKCSGVFRQSSTVSEERERGVSDHMWSGETDLTQSILAGSNAALLASLWKACNSPLINTLGYVHP